MKKIFFVIAFIGLYSCNSTKQATTATSDKFVAEKLLDYDLKEVKERFSDANIEEGTNLYDEGTVERSYAILYPGTKDEMHITWNANNEIFDIRFAEEGKWRSASGVKVGTTYKELNGINGIPVSFYGFGWDYSGAVVWNGGKLEDTDLRVFLGAENEPSDKFYGDQVVKASPQEIENMNLKVQAVVLKKS
ncbi:hypothetical protein RM545_10165 [Zunongwangia sp. F260]|uniref:Lipoprotein n=1 Tax=Autumnicola lenta TaxID=3075593 RepID=A0ABU3CL75_9FLAO|nr:hypothetical protein [Zunongwangia sp. F260]MDT0647056.1 hypothetical protein [Zunongwangia sp. F260]